MGLYVFNWPISVLGDWKDISIAHVIIIIKSEVSTFPIVIIFFRGCVPEVFVTSYSVTYCINVPGNPGICFHYYCAVYDECKYSDTFWLADHTRLFVQYTISLSSLCKLIWRHWTYKMSVRYILSSGWVRLSIFSPLSIIQYVGLYVFSSPISLVLIERKYILCLNIIIKSEVYGITQCLVLGHETMVSAVCLSIFSGMRYLRVLFWSFQFLFISLQYRHNERDGVSNNQPHDCLLNHLFRRRSRKISKLRVTGFCAGNSPLTGEFRTKGQ